MNIGFTTQEVDCGAYPSIRSTLLSQRTIFLSQPIDNQTAEEVIAQLLYLDSINHEPIKLIINSPGGGVSAGFGIIDYMHGIESPVHTHAFGAAASMAALILANGEKGYRTASPSTEILIHQPLLNHLSGQVSDIEIATRALLRTKSKLCTNLAECTGRTKEEIDKTIDRDNWFTANEALAFGLIDSIESNVKAA